MLVKSALNVHNKFERPKKLNAFQYNTLHDPQGRIQGGQRGYVPPPLEFRGQMPPSHIFGSDLTLFAKELSNLQLLFLS